MLWNSGLQEGGASNSPGSPRVGSSLSLSSSSSSSSKLWRVRPIQSNLVQSSPVQSSPEENYFRFSMTRFSSSSAAQASCATSKKHSSSVNLPPRAPWLPAAAISSTVSQATAAADELSPSSSVMRRASSRAAWSSRLWGAEGALGAESLMLLTVSAMSFLRPLILGWLTLSNSCNSSRAALYSRHSWEVTSTSHSSTSEPMDATLLSLAFTSSTASQANRASLEVAPCFLESSRASATRWSELARTAIMGVGTRLLRSWAVKASEEEKAMAATRAERTSFMVCVCLLVGWLVLVGG
mmetsp:Transcript_18347/g.51133  ORF Transcript_18347/g.51133 Transcript_18347/m.51133 type:complete len:297 (+) Transcript_18347:82-972(+)